jgi:hypothetical protein
LILPLFGFIIGCLVFGIIGMILLKVTPFFRLTISNLSLFILAALPGALIAGNLYGWIAVDSNGQLTSTITVVSVLLTHLFFILFLNDILFPFIQGGIDAQCDIQEER